MSTLWTPGGERPVNPSPTSPASEPEWEDDLSAGEHEPTEEEMREHVEALRQQLAQTPVEVIIAQLCSQLFEVAALHLSVQPPVLPQAQLAIDAMAALVEGLGDRLGRDVGALTDGLTQLRLAFVQIRAAFVAAPERPTASEPASPSASGE